MWEDSFVAMTVLLGVPATEAGLELDPARRDAARDVVVRLSDPRRPVRARALAVELARIGVAVDGMRLA